MNKFRVIIGCLIALLLASLPLAASYAAENPALTDTKATARTEVWKAINSGKAGSATVAIMENGKLVYAEGFGMADREQSIPVDKTTLFNIGSISKVYAATAIMLLVDDGKVNLDKPVTTYLPEFTMADERYKDITVRMLLNHSSGLPGTVGPNSFGYEYHKDFYKDVLDILAKSHLKHRPGEMAPYTNDGFTLAEMVVAKVSGKSYIQFLGERVFGPLALSRTGPSVGQRQERKDEVFAKYYTASGGSEPLEVLSLWGSGGLSATPEDLCKFGDSISGAGPQILSKASLAEMRKIQPSELYNKLPGASFGLGWDMTEYAPIKAIGLQVLGKTGGTGQYTSMLYTVPDKRISVAVIATGPQSGAPQIAADILETYLADRGLYVKKAKEVTLPAKAQAIPPELAAYEGFYAGENMLFRVKFNLPEKTVTVYRVAGGQEEPMLSLIYHDNYFHAKGQKFYFTTVDNRDYFVEYWSSQDSNAIAGQKLAAVKNPVELNATVDNRQWLRRNAKAYEGTLLSADGYIFTSRALKDLPGYIDFMGTKKVETPSSAGFAVNATRDLTEVILTEKDGITWAWVSGYVFTPADSAPALTRGDMTVTIGPDGHNQWLRVTEDAILSFLPAKKGRVIVYNADGHSIYDNYVDKESKILAPVGGFVEMAGNPGDIFKVTAITSN